MSIDAAETMIELEYDLRAARKRTYFIALITALVGAIPATMLKDAAPWFVLVPITLGGALVIGFDIRAAWRKSHMLRLVRDITASELKVTQSLARLSRQVVSLQDKEAPIQATQAEVEKETAILKAQAREERLESSSLVLADA